MGLGYLPATMERIFDLASSCEGGMLRNRSGRLTPEGYIGTWLKEFANPLVFQRTQVRFSAGDGFYNAILSTRLDEAVALLAKAERPRQANELHDTQTVTLDLVHDTDAVLTLQAGLGIDPWRLVGAQAVTHRSGERNPALGYNPAPARAQIPLGPTALKLNEHVRLLKGPEDAWRCGGWQYALVGKQVRTLWQAELAYPGHHRGRIATFRDALDRAPPAPAGLVVEIDGTMTDEKFHLRKVEELRQKAGAGDGIFRVPVTADNEYALTTLPEDCAKWFLPNHRPPAVTELAALAL